MFNPTLASASGRGFTNKNDGDKLTVALVFTAVAHFEAPQPARLWSLFHLSRPEAVSRASGRATLLFVIATVPLESAGTIKSYACLISLSTEQRQAICFPIFVEADMADDDNQTGAGPKKERGPSFPFIGLEKAVDRTRELYAKAKRFDVRLADAAADWKYGAKSSGAFQTAAALLAFGLIEDSGSGEARKLKVSELGWRIIADDRPGMREKHMAEAALKPKLIAEFAERWGDGRPDDSHAISDLKFEHGFTDESAPRFLRVFDDTIRFTTPEDTGKMKEAEKARDEAFLGFLANVSGQRGGQEPPTDVPTDSKKGISLMAGERELTTGMLSKGSSFRLIVSGNVGEKEIERLIKKLELDKEILADADEERADEDRDPRD